MTKARHENANGIRDGAEAILLCTPLDLNDKQVDRVEKALGKGLLRGLVWPRSKLEHHLRNNGWLATEHFGLQLMPGFVQLDSGKSELTTQRDLPLVGREDEVREVEDFLRGPERVLQIVAPGGTGKSRFLRALGDLSRSANRSAWLRLPGQGSIEDALSRGLPRKKPLLLCLDDAGLTLDEVSELARLAILLPGGVDAKVILAARLPDSFLIESACRDAKACVRTLRLKPLAQAPAEQIIAAECPDLPPPSIRPYFDSPAATSSCYEQLHKPWLRVSDCPR